MNILQDFKTFYLSIVLPNLPGFAPYFNESNFDVTISELTEVFEASFDINPFDITNPDEIKKLLKNKPESFVTYSDKNGFGVPNAILNTHYFNFLKYRNEIRFNDLQDFNNKLNEAFGSFTKTFQKERIKFNRNTKVASNSVIFGDVRDDYWTINKGSEKEIQYHIFKDEDELGYGLGFNAQKSMNNLTPIENVTKFIKAFILNKSRILKLLEGYDFLHEKNLRDLNNIKEGEFIIFGKIVPLKLEENYFVLNQNDFLSIYYNLRYRQFEVYKIIFESATSDPLLIQQLTHKNTMKELLNYKKQIILQGPPGTGKTREAKIIAKEILGLATVEELIHTDQFEIVQFHPSYTYEDFVRGIVSESKGDRIEYKNVNKILGEFAEKALNNYKVSIGNTNESNIDVWINEKFEDFKNNIQAKLPEEETSLTSDITIYEVNIDHFRYAENWKTPGYLKFSEFKTLIKAVLHNEIDLSSSVSKINKDKFLHAYYRYTYYNALLVKFFNEYRYESTTENIALKNYVLIIDEINRANLSSVLGELIYALEYRGEAVESMYEVDENSKLILPPNLYIIGTMNTADRSVGHIDYAIRRRFAFVDVLPKDLSEDNTLIFDSVLFNAVKELFTTDEYMTRSAFLSSEFDPKDVVLGHSYFIDKSTEGGSMAIRLEYEIKPILKEYIKDGILIGEGIEQKVESFVANI